jgi:hypothetical protein
MGKFKKRVTANKTPYVQRNKTMDPMRTLQLKRLVPMLFTFAINSEQSHDTQEASRIEEASDAWSRYE